MKPKRTEYKGIVFDSKAEAVFARTLDIGGHEWVYHPAEHCGHVWDFLVFPMHTYSLELHALVGGVPYRSERRVPRLTSKPMLVEYKPAMPTNTYVDNLTEQMRPDPFESVVVWGNPWDGVDTSLDGPSWCCYRVYPIFSSYSKWGWGDFIRLADNGSDLPVSWSHDTFGVLGIDDDMAQEAKRHRFDLAYNLAR